MEPILGNEIAFLLSLNASEESRLGELEAEFGKWECEKSDVLAIFSQLIVEGFIGLSRPEGDQFQDLGLQEALSAVSAWPEQEEQDLILFLTDAGWNRWETDDWGISTKRARQLIFAKNSSSAKGK